MKRILYTIIFTAALLFTGIYQSEAAPSSTYAKKTVTPITVKPSLSQNNQAPIVSPLLIIANPELYLNKTISFEGEFVSFTSLGLDYKPAFRDGTKYIGILMRNPNVIKNTIPLSELKMFMNRDMAEKNIDLETGDKFKLTGKVFSTALGDPWLDITEFKITSSKKEQDDKTKQ